MTRDIECALQEWKFARENTIQLINALGDDGLRETLPRPVLDTFCKHFQEMINVQKSYSEAILNGIMRFGEGNDKLDGQATCAELIGKMNEVDVEMEKIIEQAPSDCEIDWGNGESKTISSQLCALATHEIFHVGQLVAFCYVNKIELPDYLLINWALPQID